MDRKRIIIAIIFFLICIGVGYMLYRVFFATKNPEVVLVNEEPQTGDKFPEANQGSPLPNQGDGTTPLPTSPGTDTQTSNQTEPTPGIIAGEVEQLVRVAVTGVSADTKSGNARFYNDEDGKFYRLNANGKVEPLSDQVLYNVQDVTWSPISDEGIIEYPDGANIYYNFETKNQASLPKHWDTFSFSPTGEKIAAKSLAFSPENRWLVSSDPDGNNIELIEPLGDNSDKVIVDWSPNKQVVALSTTGEDLGSDRQEVLFIGRNGENFKSTVTEGRGFQPLWSPKGDELLYSVYSDDNDFKPNLWLVGGQGDTIGANRRPLNLNTWANKCSYRQTDLYCAVPISLERGAGMFPATATQTQDILYKINPSTGQKELIPLSSSSSINNLSFSPDGNYLYYTEGGTNRLRKIKLR